LNFIKNCGFQLFKYFRFRKFVVPVLGKIEKESTVPVISKTLKKTNDFHERISQKNKSNDQFFDLFIHCRTTVTYKTHYFEYFENRRKS
jgi:hypothetical protein